MTATAAAGPIHHFCFGAAGARTGAGGRSCDDEICGGKEGGVEGGRVEGTEPGVDGGVDGGGTVENDAAGGADSLLIDEGPGPTGPAVIEDGVGGRFGGGGGAVICVRRLGSKERRSASSAACTSDIF